MDLIKLVFNNKSVVVLTLLFAFLNGLIFRTPIKMSLVTSQLGLFAYFLVLYIFITAAPILLALNLIKGKKLILIFALIFVIVPIIVAFSWIGIIDYLLPAHPVPFRGEKVNEDVYLDFSSEYTMDLKSKNFCFKVFLPSFLPNQSDQWGVYQMKPIKVSASTKACEHQLVIVTYTPDVSLIQVPKNYDFDFRKGFENLKGLRAQALGGTKVLINGVIVYRVNIGYGSPSWDTDAAVNKASVFYWERNNTLIFLQFDPYNFSEGTYKKIVESMEPIN